MFLWIVALVQIVSFSVEGRWAKPEDATISVEVSNIETVVKKDGSTEDVIELKYQILKEQGRSFAANYTLQYNGDNEELKILEAKTIIKDKEFVLSKDMIEDKPLASSPQGFDQKRQILLSFPNVEIGAMIYLKYTRKELKPILDGFFACKQFFGRNYTNASKIKITSEIPLHLFVNDPKTVLSIIKDKEVGFQKLEIELIKPLYEGVINEVENSDIDEKHLTHFTVSTLTDWKILSSMYAPGYEKVLNQDLPQAYQEIMVQALKEKAEIDQVNQVVSLIQEKVQYMGDWRSVSGRFFPRDLEKIATSKLADCKDFSTSVGAILRKMGYQAQSVFVQRGEGALNPSMDSLPYDFFNHAIIKVKTPNGNIFWVDPTNPVSMAQGIFLDIAGKKVLVLGDKDSSYEEIPNVIPEHAQVVVEQEIQIKDRGTLKKGTLVFKGESALELAGKKLFASEQQIKDSLFNMLSGGSLEESGKIEMILPKLDSRIVDDLSVQYTFEHRNSLIPTNMGLAFSMPAGWLGTVVNIPEDHMSDVYLGSPYTLSHHYVVKNIKIKNIESLNSELHTPWMSVVRVCKYEGKDTHIRNIVTTKKSFISSEDLKSEAYLKFKSDVEKMFKSTMVILTE